MKRRIEWWIAEADGNEWYFCTTREKARDDVKELHKNLFADYMQQIKFPFIIKRKEYLLVSEKIVK